MHYTCAFIRLRTQLHGVNPETIACYLEPWTEGVNGAWVVNMAENCRFLARRIRMDIGMFYQIQVPKPWTTKREPEIYYEMMDQVP
ncbi:MAG: hypothetical protein IIA99_07600, partial [Proteobacteria bacterium]|nr:hypothetical protein [Pseudomonadota bacterium]